MGFEPRTHLSLGGRSTAVLHLLPNNDFTLPPDPGGYFICCVHVTSFSCIANVQSTHTSLSRIGILFINHKRKGRFLAVKRVLKLRPSDLDLLQFVAAASSLQDLATQSDFLDSD